jgi:hypothetical protein
MLIAKDLKEVLANVPDDAPVIIHVEVKDNAYEGHTAKYITNPEDGPYDGNGCIDDAIDKYNGAVVISDWKF